MTLSFDTRGNEKQKQAARYWCDQETTDIVYGGAKGGGKSFLIASLIFGDAFIYPGTHYFIARKKLNDLRKFTIPSIHEVLQGWGLTDRYWKFNGQDNFFTLYNNSRVYLLDASPMPSDPLYYRFGSMQFTRGAIEEAGEFEEAAKNNLAASVGRWKNNEYNLLPKLIQGCNPSKNYLYREYYRPYKEGKLPPWRKFIQSLPTDNKMLPASYIENLRRTLSKGERLRLLEGNWEFDDDPSILIPYEKILDIFTNTHVPSGKKRITADIARLGGDRIVTILWDGFRGKVSAKQRQKLTLTTSQLEGDRFAWSVGKSDVLVDSDGLGSGVEDFGGFTGFHNGAKPLPDPRNPHKGPENYDNLKSQCGFRMAERICDSQVYLECPEELRPLIIEELEQVKQKELDSDLKKGLMPKDKVKEMIGRSPDFWDAILMREYFELKPKFVPTATSI